jgi:hypothetical protein
MDMRSRAPDVALGAAADLSPTLRSLEEVVERVSLEALRGAVGPHFQGRRTSLWKTSLAEEISSGLEPELDGILRALRIGS